MKLQYVVIDSETNGLFDYSKAADADGQPRMAQLALVTLNEDLSIAREVSFLIKPDGWTMSDEAAKIHGLTQERLLADGLPIAHALSAYNAMLDASHIIVGYNVSFDLKMMRAELRRAGMPDRFETTQSIDCMRPLTNICKIAKPSGKGGYKFPKLTEAHAHFFGGDFEGAHDAMGDARACSRIFKKMVDQKILAGNQLLGVEEIR